MKTPFATGLAVLLLAVAMAPAASADDPPVTVPNPASLAGPAQTFTSSIQDAATDFANVTVDNVTNISTNLVTVCMTPTDPACTALIVASVPSDPLNNESIPIGALVDNATADAGTLVGAATGFASDTQQEKLGNETEDGEVKDVQDAIAGTLTTYRNLLCSGLTTGNADERAANPLDCGGASIVGNVAILANSTYVEAKGTLEGADTTNVCEGVNEIYMGATGETTGPLACATAPKGSTVTDEMPEGLFPLPPSLS